MKNILIYIKPVHIGLILVPLIFVGFLFFFKEHFENIVLKEADKIFFKTIAHKKYNPSFVLRDYRPIDTDKDIITALFRPFVEKASVQQLQKESDFKTPQNLKVSFIYLGKDKYVIINGVLYKEGDTISGIYKVDRIEKGRVKISWSNGEKWLYIY